MSVFGRDGDHPSCQYLAVMVQKNLATIMSVFGSGGSEIPGDPSFQYLVLMVATHRVRI